MPRRISLLHCWPLAVAALFYAWLWPRVTIDIVNSYVPWLHHIESTGRLAAFAVPFGDYPPPYEYLLALASCLSGWLSPVTLVKLVPLTGTVLLTAAVYRLCRALALPHPARVAAFVPLLPGVAFNAALLGSADALWAAPLVFAVACAVERRHLAMLICCGIAISIKQQAVFVAPFFLGLVLQRRVPMRLWVAAPLATLAMYLPATLLGWPWADLFGIYGRQAEFMNKLSLNAPNLWLLVMHAPVVGGWPLTGLALALAAGTATWFVLWVATHPLSNRALVAAALLSPLLMAGLLPRMHERYFFAADVLALVWAAAAGTRRASLDAWLVQAGSLLGILAFLSGIEGLAGLGAVAMIAATWRIAKVLLARGANDNPVMPPLRAPAYRPMLE